MTDLLKESLTIYTLPVTILLVLCLLYWVMVMLGALDTDSIDLGMDAPGDLSHGAGDLHGHGDVAGGDASHGNGGGLEHHTHWLSNTLRYFNLVEVPIMVLVSIGALFTWLIQVNLNYWLNDHDASLMGFGFLALSMIASAFVTKVVTTPLIPLFRQLNQGMKAIELIGEEAIVKSGQINESYGQIEVSKDGAPLILNARVAEGGEPHFKGEKVIIYREDPAKGIYYVRKV